MRKKPKLSDYSNHQKILTVIKEARWGQQTSVDNPTQRHRRALWRYGIRKEFKASNFPSAQKRLDLRPHFFNRVDIRTVSRQIERLHTRCLQSFLDSFHMVRTQIVHHDDVARTKSWNQSLFQILDKAFSCRSALVSYKGVLSIKTNRRKHSRCLRCI